MKLFIASFAIVTAVSFAVAASGLVSGFTSESSERTGVERTLASSIPVDTTNQFQATSYPVDYEICDQYCKLANDQSLAIQSMARANPITYVTVDAPTILTPIIGVK